MKVIKVKVIVIRICLVPTARGGVFLVLAFGSHFVNAPPLSPCVCCSLVVRFWSWLHPLRLPASRTRHGRLAALVWFFVVGGYLTFALSMVKHFFITPTPHTLRSRVGSFVWRLVPSHATLN